MQTICTSLMASQELQIKYSVTLVQADCNPLGNMVMTHLRRMTHFLSNIAHLITKEHLHTSQKHPQLDQFHRSWYSFVTCESV